MVGREAFWFLSNYPRSASSFPVLSSSLGNRDYNGATVPLYGYAAPAYGYAATAPLYNYAAPVADLAPPAYGYAAPTYAAPAYAAPATAGTTIVIVTPGSAYPAAPAVSGYYNYAPGYWGGGYGRAGYWGGYGWH
jgi:hypothetical protein